MAEVVLLFDSAICSVAWQGEDGEMQHLQLLGPQCCIIASGVPHSCSWQRDAEILVLYIDQRLLDRDLGKKMVGVTAAESNAAAQHDLVAWLLASILRHLCDSVQTPDLALLGSLSRELACWLARRLSDGSSIKRPPRGLSRWQREKVMRFMHANMKHDIHVIDLAKQAGVGPQHFAELFKNTTGKSVYRYLTQIRMLRAHEILLTGDHLLSDVALMVGFTDVTHFSKKFTAFFNYSPRFLLINARSISEFPPTQSEDCPETS